MVARLIMGIISLRIKISNHYDEHPKLIGYCMSVMLQLKTQIKKENFLQGLPAKEVSALSPDHSDIKPAKIYLHYAILSVLHSIIFQGWMANSKEPCFLIEIHLKPLALESGET